MEQFLLFFVWINSYFNPFINHFHNYRFFLLPLLVFYILFNCFNISSTSCNYEVTSFPKYSTPKTIIYFRIFFFNDSTACRFIGINESLNINIRTTFKQYLLYDLPQNQLQPPFILQLLPTRLNILIKDSMGSVITFLRYLTTNTK